MEKGFIMTEEEIHTSLLMHGRVSLERITSVKDSFKPELQTLEIMLKKQFFVELNGEKNWNRFVEALLYCAMNPQSEMIIKDGTGECVALYFYMETMVLLKKNNKNMYEFYYVPLIPKAIGGLKRLLDGLNKNTEITIDGWNNNEHTLSKSLLCSEEGVMLKNKDHDYEGVKLKSSDMFEVIKELSYWVINSHGQSMAAKGVLS